MAEQAVILLAEDDEDWILLIMEAFTKARITNPLHVVWNGQEAISYLKGTGQYSNRDEYPLPDLLLLDLKMPRMNGFDVLKWLRAEPGLSGLRVLVLTSSDEIRDVNEAYRLGANSFMVKPNDFENTAELSRLINDFWLKASRTPESFRPPPAKGPKNTPETDTPGTGSTDMTLPW